MEAERMCWRSAHTFTPLFLIAQLPVLVLSLYNILTRRYFLCLPTGQVGLAETECLQLLLSSKHGVCYADVDECWWCFRFSILGQRDSLCGPKDFVKSPRKLNGASNHVAYFGTSSGCISQWQRVFNSWKLDQFFSLFHPFLLLNLTSHRSCQPALTIHCRQCNSPCSSWPSFPLSHFVRAIKPTSLFVPLTSSFVVATAALGSPVPVALVNGSRELINVVSVSRFPDLCLKQLYSRLYRESLLMFPRTFSLETLRLEKV